MYIYILRLNIIVFNSEPWNTQYTYLYMYVLMQYFINSLRFHKICFDHIDLNSSSLPHYFLSISCPLSTFNLFFVFLFLIFIHFLLEVLSRSLLFTQTHFFSINRKTILFFIKFYLCSRTIGSNTIKTTSTYWCLN